METIQATTANTKKTNFFINRNFALLWGGQAVSNVGDYVFNTTLILWIATIIARNQTWAPLAVSGVLLSASIPIFFIGPIAGVFADRWDKRKTMLRMDATRATLILLLILATGFVPLPFLPGGHLPAFWQLGAIYTTVFLTSICAQFFNPARFALMADIVEEPYRARASGLGQVTMNTALIIGPPLAAPLLFVFGVQWALIINALSFVVSFLAILAVRPPVTEGDATLTHKSVLRDLWDGLRYFVGNRVLATLVVSIIIAMLGMGALDALDIFFTTQNLHAPASLYGVIGMSAGAGAVVGAIFASMFAQRIGVIRSLWLGLLGVGLAMIIFARLTSIVPAILVLFLLGFPASFTNVVAGPIILHVTPHHMVGRFISVFTPLTTLASMLSILLASYLDSMMMRNFHAVMLGFTFGPVDTIFTATGLLVILSSIYVYFGMRGVHMETGQ